MTENLEIKPIPNTHQPSHETSTDILAVAHAQKLLIWAVLASILVAASPYLYLVVVPFKLYAVYRISKVLGFEMMFRVIYLVCMFVPLLSLIFLLMLNSKATESLRKSGVSVGLMGARPKDLEQVLPPGTSTSFQAPGVFVLSLVIVATIGGATGLLPSPLPFLKPPLSLGQQLDKIAAEANRELPKVIDEETRLEQVSAGPGSRMTYHYTLVNYPAAEINADLFVENAAPELRQLNCRNEFLAQLFKQNIEVVHAYGGADGNPIADIAVSRADCGY